MQRIKHFDSCGINRCTVYVCLSGTLTPPDSLYRPFGPCHLVGPLVLLNLTGHRYHQNHSNQNRVCFPTYYRSTVFDNGCENL